VTLEICGAELPVFVRLTGECGLKVNVTNFLFSAGGSE
jgi:hypothetical protein